MKKKKQDGRKRSGRKGGSATLKQLDSLGCPLERFDYTRYGVPDREPEKGAFELAWVVYEYLVPGFLTLEIPKEQLEGSAEHHNSWENVQQSWKDSCFTKHERVRVLGNKLRDEMRRRLKDAVESGDGSFFKAFGKAIEQLWKKRFQPVHVVHTLLQIYAYKTKPEDRTMTGFKSFWTQYFKEFKRLNKGLNISPFPDPKTVRKACKELNLKFIRSKRSSKK